MDWPGSLKVAVPLAKKATLPLSVHKYGLSAPELDWARALGSGFLALVGAGCGATFLQWLFERKGSRNHGKQDQVRAKGP